MKIICPNCQVSLTVIPDKEGQATCSKCGSYFPVKWAKSLEKFEKKREAIKGGD